MNVISNVLYWISTGLLVPVIVLLIYFFIRALVLIGAFFGAYLQMKKTTAKIYSELNSLTVGNLGDFAETLKRMPPSAVGTYARKLIDARSDEAKTNLLLSEYEMQADKNIAASKTLTKMGPILGLMGTLIPMGPALVGLASGDISSMAYNMQVAFATTVVGLTVSAIGFVTQQYKERWVFKDLTILEYISDLFETSKSEQK